LGVDNDEMRHAVARNIDIDHTELLLGNVIKGNPRPVDCDRESRVCENRVPITSPSSALIPIGMGLMEDMIVP
jgi:hydrogenase maturation factor